MSLDSFCDKSRCGPPQLLTAKAYVSRRESLTSRRPVLDVSMEILMHTNELDSLSIRIEHSTLLAIIRGATLSRLPFRTGSNLEVLSTSLFNKEPAENSSDGVKAHKNEECVGTDVRNHVGTREGEAER